MTEHPFTDPPGMPEDERMTDAELKAVREYLGLSGDWLGRHLGVAPRTVRRWEEGKYPIPDGVRLAIEELEARTGQYVTALVEQAMDVPDAVMVTYRHDEQYRAADPSSPFPASWHRMAVMRAAQEVPALSIVFADAHDRAGAPA